jgi:MFS family permease
MSRLPFFYGWVMVGAAAVNGSFVLGSAQFALGAFLVPMEDELGWSRSVLFGALALRQLLGGLVGPLVGPLIDGARAPRIVMPAGAILLGVSLAAVKWIHDPIWFLVSYGIVGSFGFALINSTMWEAVVLKWFVRKRARAMVWTSFGGASASMIFPALVTGLIFVFGWRDAWLWYGVITIVVLLPAGLAVRSHPEQLGLVPDGEPAPPPPPGDPTHPVEQSLTRSEALRTPSFWLIAGAFTLTGFTITGFQAHWIPYFRDIGFSAGVAAASVSAYGAANVASRVLWGYLASRYSLHRLMVAHTIMAGLGMGIVLLIDNTVMLFVWAVYHGIFLGSYNYLHGLISTEYFGRMNIGAIRGLMLPPAALMRAPSALALSAMHSVRGSYTIPFVAVWVMWGFVTAALLAARRPQTKQR